MNPDRDRRRYITGARALTHHAGLPDIPPLRRRVFPRYCQLFLPSGPMCNQRWIAALSVAVENLVTSDTKLEIPYLFYDGGFSPITVTSVSGPSCPSRFTSCWRIPPQSPGMMLLTPRTASQDFFPRAGTHRNQIVPVHHFLRYAYLRASVDGITNVCG